ncbi:cation:proton antiporter regulatory subunit [Hamadaea tsunoensis]|uniref:cation:proton antiporter regulatory subunit n=1 Tax=Hamadaea tsunoensis TaxID=53368 RepID=UPI000488D50B|nr:cation:proton antiporter regulatory subunit [Hamadaea tsunoensis]
MDVERTALPGIGLRHEFQTTRGQRAAVVSHHNGRRDIVVFDRRDPDTTAAILTLTAEEANGIAELLGTARIVERLTELQRQVTGLVTIQVQILDGSPYAGRPLGDARVRTRTGASIVAVIRDHEVSASPRPDFRFEAGDLVVAVGTADGTASAAEIFTRG